MMSCIFVWQAFRLGNTLSDNGSVTRGLCHITDASLQGLREHTTFFKTADGAESAKMDSRQRSLI